MKLSHYFKHHYAAYDAELNDLVSDSEGKNVLAKRLADKRGQIDFLLCMMEDSPEMLAVVFHQGLGFTSTPALDALVGLTPETFPSWPQVCANLRLTPQAQALAERVLQEPGGAQFMTLAAGLEYLYHRGDPHAAQSLPPEHEHEHDADDAELQEAHDLEQAGAEWLTGQGFDAKPGQT